MLSRAYRFHGYNSLNHVYGVGKSKRNNSVSLKWIDDNKKRHPRFAVVVSKKVNKSAVTRNRIRRRIFEIIRQLLPKLNNCPDVIIAVFDDRVATMDSTELHKQISGLFESAGLLK